MRPITKPRLQAFAIAVIGTLGALLVALVPTGSWTLRLLHRPEGEIAWLESTKPFTPLKRWVDSRLGQLHFERIQRELLAGRLAEAVRAFRLARAQQRSAGRPADARLLTAGIEVLNAAADHMEILGRPSLAADWDDSLFVFAIRAQDRRFRRAAQMAFNEGLALRLRDGKPCAAWARIEWARKGLGGLIPGVDSRMEVLAAKKCEQRAFRPVHVNESRVSSPGGMRLNEHAIAKTPDVGGAGDEPGEKREETSTARATRLLEQGIVEQSDLLWTLRDNGSKVVWSKADAYCEACLLGGYTDWRLPSIAELGSLYTHSSERYQIVAPFRLTGPDVWSRTRDRRMPLALDFGYVGGDRYPSAQVPNQPDIVYHGTRAYVLCVRDSKR